jgi:hypothetical protein
MRELAKRTGFNENYLARILDLPVIMKSAKKPHNKISWPATSHGSTPGEHHPFVIKLDGSLLKLNSRNTVVAVITPEAVQADGVSTRRALESLQDCTAEAAAQEDTHLSLSPPWWESAIDGRGR